MKKKNIIITVWLFFRCLYIFFVNCYYPDQWCGPTTFYHVDIYYKGEKHEVNFYGGFLLLEMII